MGIVILGIMFFVAGIITYVLAPPTHLEKNDGGSEYQAEGKSKRGIMIAAIGICIIVGAYLSFNIGNLDRKAYLENFYQNNASIYQVAADKTATYLSTDQFVQQLVAGSIEKQQLANTISQRIVEWRDQVSAYNQTLKEYRVYQSNFWFNIFIPTLEDIKPLSIQ